MARAAARLSAKTQAEGKVSTSRALAENFCNREGGSVKEQQSMTKIQCDNASRKRPRKRALR
jgi:hypothetical protein